MKILTPNTALVMPKFIYYRMQTIRFDCSTHKRYWIQQYSKIKVAIPPISEQECIVARIEELFSELDNGVETLRKTKQQLAVYRQAVISTAFPKMNEDNTVRLDEIADITGGITKGRDLSKQETVYLPYLRAVSYTHLTLPTKA